MRITIGPIEISLWGLTLRELMMSDCEKAVLIIPACITIAVLIEIALSVKWLVLIGISV